MERDWIDDEGRLRLEHDENYQMVSSGMSSDEVWLKMDSWDLELACKMIVLGYNEDVKKTISYGFEHCPHGSTGLDRANALKTVMNRVLTLARSAIAIGILKEHDTPANWIKWAKNKGYKTEHLNPAVQVEAFQLALQNSPDDCPGVCESYREQLAEWKSPFLTVPAFDHTIEAMGNDGEVSFLHLSDLHISTQDEATKYSAQLNTDLLNELKIKRLDYLILSGDIGNKSTTEEYQAAVSFVEKLIEKFDISREKIIITPGNHDVSYALSKNEGYQFLPSFSNHIKKFIGMKNKSIINKEGYRQRFKYFNEDFYYPVTNENYPLDYNEQAILHVDEGNKLLMMTLNSAWEIDHENEKRASINGTALAKAIDEIHNEKYQGWLKIAVWHHPVTGKETMNDEFLEQLVTNGFNLGMHGHIHEAKDGAFKYDSERGLRIIGAGTFGAPVKEQVPGIPLQYNLLVWNKKEAYITVHTRKKDHANGAWKADSRWGDSNDPKPFYKVDLSNVKFRFNS